jgi:hypothetical protein
MYKCPGYPCKILDPVLENPVVCNEKGFWEKHKEEKK